MECPKCEGKSRVVDSRKVETIVFRRRICNVCGYRFYTEEIQIEKDEADIYMAALKREQRKKYNKK